MTIAFDKARVVHNILGIQANKAEIPASATLDLMAEFDKYDEEDKRDFFLAVIRNYNKKLRDTKSLTLAYFDFSPEEIQEQFKRARFELMDTLTKELSSY